MKPSPAIIVAVILVVFAWASLFITVLNQSHRTNELLKDYNTLLQNDTAILHSQKKTEDDLQSRISDLQSHVDCLFNLATQTNPNARISDAATCTITTKPASRTTSHSTTSTKQNTPTSPPATQTQTADTSPAPTPQPTPQSPLCKLTLGLLGC